MKHTVIDRPHTVTSYDMQLAEVRAIINAMADLAQRSLSDSLGALQTADRVAANEIVAKDQRIDELELSLERLVLLTITSRAPMAEDLRYLIVAIRIGTMLERTGDQAKRIARRVKDIEPGEIGRDMTRIRAMARYASEMVERAIESFNKSDEAVAKRVIRDDAELNGMNANLVRSCSEAMDAGEQSIGHGVEIISIGKQLERVGDYATNIAQEVLYMITGTRESDAQ